MKISRHSIFLVKAVPSSDGWSMGHTTVFVKLETESGLSGWGEAYALQHRQRACHEIIDTLCGALAQMSNASPRRFLNEIAKPMETKHVGIDYTAAVSAIEIALWDLLGKSLNQPVHALLGGAIADRIPVYANAWDNPVQSAEAVAARCRMLCAQGYRAVKIYPLRRATLAEAEACVRLTREEIGPDVDLMLDFAVPSDLNLALKAARLFEPYDPYWIEEPVTGNNLDALTEFRTHIRTRLTTGERQSSIHHCRDVLKMRGADVLNPDIAGAGGILSMLEIGAMADAYDVQVSPHNWNSTSVGFLAMLHVCAVMPNAKYAELFYDYMELGARFSDCDFTISGGYASLPQRPGLGIEMNEEALRSLEA